MKFYRCWAGTRHEAINVPEGATDDTLLQFHCACMGRLADHPDVKRELERGTELTMLDAQILAERRPPPRTPVVRVGDLEEE